VRKLCDDTAIFGTPEQIGRKLEALRDGGAEYVIVNFGGSIKNIRRFAKEIMPHFADKPRLQDAAK
jgi:alkanesulfonate monooxygenase SsuD/methylene tetrahydromethanopterin reductase-like flavin-dependent oxidoreductase (luciferase family)